MPAINPFPARLPDDKAEAIAARRTAELKEQKGLFADLVEPVTPEMVQAGVKAHLDRFNAAQVLLEERAARFRAEAEKHRSEEEVAAKVEKLRALPDCPAYRCDHWRRVLKRPGFPPPEF